MLAFTFPGQGSQRPGMGTPWRDHPSFELVEQASDVTGRDVAALLCDADQDTLKQTDNAQLATFVLSLIVLDSAERVGLEPSVCAGHSLGEYTALVAAGAIDYEDALRLVSERGAAMQHAAEVNPGTMAAVLGMDDDAIESACTLAEGDVWVANYNAPGQVVIAGTVEAVTEAGHVAKQMGGKKVLPIPVGGAFHTPLMNPARDRLRKALAAVTFHPPEPAVVANVDARLHPDAKDWQRLLSAQLTSPVRWRQTLDALVASGTQTFLEIGPGGVLTSLARRMLPTAEAIAVSVATPEELDRLLESLAGRSTAQQEAIESRVGERFHMSERLVVSPAAGIFEPDATVTGLTPGKREPGSDPVQIDVGSRVGTVGNTEIRSAFAGSLEGILVLAGERVSIGQPVAWLRAPIKEDG
ncbi:MAG: ACP S-malonyltransferase [Acidimicrobiales bacterium]